MSSIIARDGASYDVTADGQRFIVNSRLSGTAPSAPLTLVQNFANELRAAEAKTR